MSVKNEKCVVDGEFVQPCWVLSEVLEPTQRKGISLVNYSDLTTGKQTRSTVIVKSGKHSKCGIILHNCPFCRENISKHLEPKIHEPE